MRLSLNGLQGRSQIVLFVALGVALISCSEASTSLPTAQQIVRDMDGAKFTYVHSVNGYPGWKTTFRSNSASNPRITDVLSDSKQGFAQITLAMEYTQDGTVSHDAIFEVTLKLYDQGWRFQGEISGISNEYDWVVLQKSAASEKGSQSDMAGSQGPEVPSAAQARAVASSGAGPSAQLPYAGRWVGEIKWGLASSVAVVTLTGATAGEAAGTTRYTKDRESSPYCEGTLILSESADGQYVFQEQIVRTRGLECPGGGTLRISMPDEATANAAWDNHYKPGKVGFRGALRKQ